MAGINVLSFSFFRRSLSCLALVIFAFLPYVSLATTTPATATATVTAEIAAEDTTQIPVISSLDFPSENMWHNRTAGELTWRLPAGVTAVAVEVASTSNQEPLEVYKPPVASFSVDETMLHEGAQYLTLQFKDEEGWGEIHSYQLLIDLTPPEPFVIETQTVENSFPRLLFNTTDSISGLERYEVYVPDQPVAHLSATQASAGYVLSDLPDGKYTVMVKAYDQAENVTTSVTTVTIAAGWQAETETASVMSLVMNVGLVILLIVVGLELLYIWYLQRQSVKREAALRKEAAEVEKQMHKVFSALRDEVYDQIRLMTKPTKLSKREKEAVEGLNKALEVSELLLEKEVDDVTGALKKK